MRALEKWIWLDSERYENSQTTVFHPTSFNATKDGNYTVAEFTKNYSFNKKIKLIKLRFSGDTTYDLWLNGKIVANGPVNIGGDYAFNETCRNQHYATEVDLCPMTKELYFFARVKLMPVQINEYSNGHGGFMLTAHIIFEDDTITFITTDKSWKARKNGQYTSPYHFDGRIQPDSFINAVEIPNIWHSQTAPIPLREEHLLQPNNNHLLQIPAGKHMEIKLEYDKVYAAYLALTVRTTGLLKVCVKCFELEIINSIEHFIFDSDTDYRGLQMHSVGGYIVEIENLSYSDAEIKIGAIETCYPVTDCAITKTSDKELNKVLELCTHALKYCRQNMHLDSPKHCEPLACTGDYYIETLMTAFSFGDMRLAEFDVRRTAELLRYNNGRMFHTTYSLIWVLMAYDVYMFTANSNLLEDCLEGLIALLNRFEGYIGSNGLIENPPDYMFVDWLDVDGIAMHHPSKNLGQSCLNMFYYGALVYGAKIFEMLHLDAMATDCVQKAEQLKYAINRLLYNEELGLYCEGLNTPTPNSELNEWLPQSNGKIYYRQHANILAAYFGICDLQKSKQILSAVVNDKSLGECQPYFMHFLLEAIYRNDLREEYTLKVLEHWKDSVRECDKGLQEGFILPQNYTFDLSHAWAGTPLYALPKALLGFEMLEPGFRKIKLNPSLLNLSYATVEMLTPYGKIVCEQSKNDDLQLDIPKEISVI